MHKIKYPLMSTFTETFISKGILNVPSGFMVKIQVSYSLTH